MAKQEDIDTVWVEEIFTRNKFVIFAKRQDMFEKQKHITNMISKIRDSEKHRDNLKKYLKLLEIMVHKSSQIGQLTTNLTNEIKDVQKSLACIKQDVAVLESKSKLVPKQDKEDEKSVSDKKNILSELYDNNFEMLLKKEKRSVELKKQSIDDTSTIFKEKKVELDILIKEYELMKAKNIQLREITISMNIEQKI